MFDFLFFAIRLASERDEMTFEAARVLAMIDVEYEGKFVEIEKDKKRTFNALRKFSVLMSENLCIRSVDNFLAYLSETIQMCMKSRPEMLRSSETIKKSRM